LIVPKKPISRRGGKGKGTVDQMWGKKTKKKKPDQKRRKGGSIIHRPTSGRALHEKHWRPGTSEKSKKVGGRGFSGVRATGVGKAGYVLDCLKRNKRRKWPKGHKGRKVTTTIISSGVNSGERSILRKTRGQGGRNYTLGKGGFGTKVDKANVAIRQRGTDLG